MKKHTVIAVQITSLELKEPCMLTWFTVINGSIGLAS